MASTSTSPIAFNKELAIERLTALWALNEAGMGGILHALKLPFTGLVVGGMAVILITLIAFYAQNKKAAIFKALIIVLIVKAVVSPHSPFPAYLAVGFQAMLGMFLFSVIPNIRVGAFLLGTLAMLQSALQKLLLLLLFFGMSLVEAVDAFFHFIVKQLGTDILGEHIAFSYWLIGGFLLFYWVGGMLIGWTAGWLTQAIEPKMRQLDSQKLLPNDTLLPKKKKRKWWQRPLFRMLFLLAFVLLIFHFILPTDSASVKYVKAGYLLVRTLVILLLWYLVIAPLFTKLLQQFLKKKQSQYQAEVDQVLAFLPTMRSIVKLAWQESATTKGFWRIKDFLLLLISYTLIYEGY